jgi:hypothetical protein
LGELGLMMRISFQGLYNEHFKHPNYLCFEQVMSLECFEISQQNKLKLTSLMKILGVLLDATLKPSYKVY